MSTLVSTSGATTTRGSWAGVRMTANEFMQLADEVCYYELVDGVVLMSPSPTPVHQVVAAEILTQLSLFVRDRSVGCAFMEVDVHLGKGPTGGDLVYRPDVVFVRADCLAQITDRIEGAPELVVEVISETSRRFDTETKKNDYERLGVKEYWLIDPQGNAMTFYRLEGDRFVEVAPTGDSFPSQMVPGFALDLPRVRKAFKPW